MEQAAKIAYETALVRREQMESMGKCVNSNNYSPWSSGMPLPYVTRHSYPNLRVDDPKAPAEEQRMVTVTIQYDPHPNILETIFPYWHGPYLETYCRTGKLAKIVTFERDLIEGAYDLYHLNGSPKHHSDCQKGKNQGWVYGWTEEGMINFQGFYEGGNLQKLWQGELTVKYHKSEQLHFKAHFREGRLEGPYVEFGKLGQLLLKGNFSKGIAVGTWLPETVGAAREPTARRYEMTTEAPLPSEPQGLPSSSAHPQEHAGSECLLCKG